MKDSFDKAICFLIGNLQIVFVIGKKKKNHILMLESRNTIIWYGLTVGNINKRGESKQKLKQLIIIKFVVL